MKRSLLLTMSLAITACWLGCQGSNEPPAPQGQPAQPSPAASASTTPNDPAAGDNAPDASGETLLVSLSVPNMV